MIKRLLELPENYSMKEKNLTCILGMLMANLSPQMKCWFCEQSN